MRNVIRVLALVVGGGLLLASQAVSGLSGERLHQWHLSQQQIQTENQMQAQQLNKEQIREMQYLLTLTGFDVSEVEGVMNEETRRALCDFQAAKGLTITGEPNAETLRALSLNVEQMEYFGLSPAFGNTEYDNSNCCP